MKKHFSLVFAIAFNIAGAVAAHAAPAANSGPMQPGLTTPVAVGCRAGVQRRPDGSCTTRRQDYSKHYAADYRGYRSGYRRAYSYGSWMSPLDPFAPGSGFCAFGDYVACAYSGTFCWRRCW